MIQRIVRKALWGLFFFAFFEKFFVPILTSGGPASFIMPLQIGKTPIVVPRQHQYNEHVNDHQVEFARNVAQRMGTIIPVEDIETLGDIITNYDQIVAGMQHWTFANDHGQNPQMQLAQRYVAHWQEMREKNRR